MEVLSLPLIDISPFATSGPGGVASLAGPSLTESQRATVAALRAALRHPGFFYLTGHGVSPQLMEQVVDLGRRFYEENTREQRSEIRRRDVGDGDGDGARGWQDVDDDCTDWHEPLDFYAEIPRDGDEMEAHRRFKRARTDVWPGVDGLLEGRNKWPRHPAEMEGVYLDYVARMRGVGTAVMRAMGHALELEDPEYFDEMTRDSFWCLRVMGYPPVSEEKRQEIDASCGEHSDYGCLTLLYSDDIRGALKVKVVGNQDRSGVLEGEAEKEQWVDADPVKGAFVVNIGDMVEQWTGGWAKSTRHKVVHTADRYRISVPFFFEPSKHVIVRRLPEFGGQPEDPEVRYWDHLVSKTDGSFYRKVTW